jgi:hypothetical protein
MLYISQIFHSIAGTTTKTNDLVVLGYIDATNNISYGTLTNGMAAVYLMYTNNSVELGASQISTAFYWQDNLTNTPRAKMQLDGTNALSIYSTNGDAGFFLNPNAGSLTLSGSNSGITLSASNASITLSGSNSSIVLSGTNSKLLVSGTGSGIMLSGVNSSITLVDGTVLSNAASLRGSSLYQVGSTNPYQSIGTNGVVNVTGSGMSFTGTNGNTGVTLNPNTGGITLAGTNSVINLSGSNSAITLSGSNSSITLSDGTVLHNAVSLRAAALYKSGSNNPYVSIGTNEVVAVTGSGMTFGSQNTTLGMNATAFGTHTIAASVSSMAIGQYNVGISTTNSSSSTWTANDSVFEVGNGSITNSSNAVTIFKNGNLRTAGTIESQAGIRVPQTGDLGMGVFTNGNNPSTLVPSTGLLYPNGQ